MANLVKHSESGSHFYTQTGEPRYEATLREARKELLLVSPTTIDKGCFVNPFLERWKLDESIRAGIENPRQPHESVEQYAQRVYDLSLMKSVTAADFGTRVHKAIEECPDGTPAGAIAPWVQKYAEWYVVSGLTREGKESTTVDLTIGIAGRLDWKGSHNLLGRCLIDFKTQTIRADAKGRKKPNYYDSWVRQLAFYAVAEARASGMFPSLPKCANVVIDSTEPTQPYIKWWTDEEIRDAYLDFLTGVWFYFHSRNFWPVGRWELNTGGVFV